MTPPHDPRPVKRWRGPRLRLHTILLAAIAGGIAHIGATFAWPHLVNADAMRRLSAVLPADKMQILPRASPKTQVIAFQAADLTYAICRFNAAEAAIAVRATLPEAGWTFSVHGPDGNSIYVVTGQDQRPTEIAVLLVPPGERFIGPLPEARLASGLAQVPLPAATGIVMIRAPDKGPAYQSIQDAELAKASCTPRRS